ncbi:MAG: hypothetical protein AAF322_21035, partial [Pseudomonadota bacterium]
NALACAAHPYRKPDETWGAWDGAQRSAGVDRNTVAKSDLGHRYFGDWHRTTFGVDVGSRTISAAAAQFALVGPKPGSPAPFTVHDPDVAIITEEDHLIVGDAERIEAAMRGLHEDVLIRAAGGDLANLRPTTIAR